MQKLFGIIKFFVWKTRVIIHLMVKHTAYTFIRHVILVMKWLKCDGVHNKNQFLYKKPRL